MQREFIATLDWVQPALTDKDKVQHWQRWQRELAPPSQLLYVFSLLPELSTVTHLPVLSFMLRIPFKLQKSYLSKDERDFHLLDNPLRKEKVFQTPMVASTSWKGALRATLWQLGYKKDDEVVTRLLGNPRDSDEHQAGRLYFYPTFFDRVGLEVINPHSRETGVGERGPILLECVPQGTMGDLVLLYVPLGPAGQSEDEGRAEVAQDMEMLAKGVQAMLNTYGFGAKTSSGFGTAANQLNGHGTLVLRAELPGSERDATPCPEPPQPAPELPRYLEAPTRLHADLRMPDGGLKSEEEYRALIENQGQKYAKKDKQLYNKAKGWWEREGRGMGAASPQEPEAKAEPVPLETPSVSEFTFQTLSELCDLTRRVAQQLRKEGEG